MDKFDWYISPSDMFSYENMFIKYSQDDVVSLDQLDSVFHQSRLETSDFLQIWQLIDIKYEQCINQIQFCYFMHAVNSRRRGKSIPTGLPLEIKEKFLAESKKEALYVRKSVNVRDVGASSLKSIQELEKENSKLELEIKAAETTLQMAQDNLSSLEASKDEVAGLVQYAKDAHNYLENIPQGLDLTEISSRAAILEQDLAVLTQMDRDLSLQISSL